jgi:hypothetical protein
MIVHMVLAAKFPEMAIDEAEAKQLADAIANYLRHSETVVTQKTKDLFVLMFALATIECTRIAAVMARKRNEAREAARSRSGAVPNVVQFDPTTGTVR